MLQVDIPEGHAGKWKIERFTVSDSDAKFENMRASFSFGSRGQYILPGTYTRLTHGFATVMSDTPSEMRDHSRFIHTATGNVLINGLGIGMVLKNVLAKDDVVNVTVNEISPEVMDLVSGCYNDDRLTMNCVDAFTWKPPKGIKFDAIWHDIWTDICTDNLEDMAKLKRRYARWLNKGGYQGCWREESLRYQKRRERKW